MALNSGSKIEVADITSALGSKIDTAGTGLSKSGTSLALASLHSAASTIGSSSAQTLAYSGTFTIPYVTRDIYGRVSGGGTRTITMPAAPSGGSANMLNGVAMAVTSDGPKFLQIGGFSFPGTIGKFKFPSGGTWRYAKIDNTGGDVGDIAGGATKTWSDSPNYNIVIAIKIA